MIMPSSTVTSLHNFAVSRTENAILGRKSTATEAAYLATTQERFGQGKSVTGITNEPTFRLV